MTTQIYNIMTTQIHNLHMTTQICNFYVFLLHFKSTPLFEVSLSTLTKPDFSIKKS